MSLPEVTVYQDRDNSFIVTLSMDDTVLTELQMQSITKFEIKYNELYYDSETTPLGFVRDNVNGKVQIKPNLLGLQEGEEDVELLVYDAAEYSNGVVWGVFTLNVKGDVIPLTP